VSKQTSFTLAAWDATPYRYYAITVQERRGVENLQAIDSDWVVDQAAWCWRTCRRGIKIGIVGSYRNTRRSGRWFSDYPDVPSFLTRCSLRDGATSRHRDMISTNA